MRRGFACLGLLAGFLSVGLIPVGSVAAQTSAPAPPPKPTAPKTGNDGGVQQLAREDGVSTSEAARRLNQQRAIANFLQTSGITQQPGFIELYVRHKPYKVILSFDRSVSEPGIMQMVPPSLRGDVLIEGNGRSHAERKATIGQLRTALASLNGKIAIGYSPVKKQFFVDTADQATASAAANLIPVNLRPMVTVNPGALPSPISSTTAVPIGVVPGDWVEAGYPLDYSTGQSSCTAGFPITFESGLQGYLTAGHCWRTDYPDANTIVYSSHNVTFPDNYFRNDDGGNYDYAIVRSDGMSSDYQMYYSNPRGTPGYGSSGWLNTKNFVRLANQWVGMYTCKSGITTGITCADTSALDYDWGRAGATYVRIVSSTATDYIADHGDSGAPTFITLDSTVPSDVSAVGIMVGGAQKDPDGYVGVYMPIDRVFDNVSNVRLMTSP